MKKTILLLAAMLLFAAQASAQFKKGNTEITLLGGGGSFSFNEPSSSSSITYITMAISPAYFIADGLSIEPELGFTLLTGEGGLSSSPGVSLTGNLSYTFASEKSNASPFIRAGFGISNGIQLPVFSGLIAQEDEGTVTIVNAGAGVKFVVGAHAAVRMEALYKLQSFSEGSRSYSYSNVGVQFGLSLLP